MSNKQQTYQRCYHHVNHICSFIHHILATLDHIYSLRRDFSLHGSRAVQVLSKEIDVVYNLSEQSEIKVNHITHDI